MLKKVVFFILSISFLFFFSNIFFLSGCAMSFSSFLSFFFYGLELGLQETLNVVRLPLVILMSPEFPVMRGKFH